MFFRLSSFLITLHGKNRDVDNHRRTIIVVSELVNDKSTEKNY